MPFLHRALDVERSCMRLGNAFDRCGCCRRCGRFDSFRPHLPRRFRRRRYGRAGSCCNRRARCRGQRISWFRLSFTLVRPIGPIATSATTPVAPAAVAFFRACGGVAFARHPRFRGLDGRQRSVGGRRRRCRTRLARRTGSLSFARRLAVTRRTRLARLTRRTRLTWRLAFARCLTFTWRLAVAARVARLLPLALRSGLALLATRGAVVLAFATPLVATTVAAVLTARTIALAALVALVSASIA
jgi:hypothetical protein